MGMAKYLLILLVTIIIPWEFSVHAEHDIYSSDALTVAFIDLGTKGDSTLIIFPNDSVMLIDGGMPLAYHSIKETLQNFHISTIDVMIATHPDQDHVGGLGTILRDDSFDVKKILIGPTSKDTATYQTFLELAGDESTVYAGDKIVLDDTVSVSVISPPKQLIPSGSNASLENSNSIVTILEYGDFVFLFTGDATHTTEKWLIQNYGDTIDADIINAPHHGSKHSSTDAFIDSVTPRLVIFSANDGNMYGHPHEQAVMRYVANGIPVVQTSMGSIIIQTDGTRCSIVSADFPEEEFACFSGIAKIPEFRYVTGIVFAGMVISVVLFRHRILEIRNHL